jgi:hypothetical protein
MFELFSIKGLSIKLKVSTKSFSKKKSAVDLEKKSIKTEMSKERFASK